MLSISSLRTWSLGFLLGRFDGLCRCGGLASWIPRLWFRRRRRQGKLLGVDLANSRRPFLQSLRELQSKFWLHTKTHGYFILRLQGKLYHTSKTTGIVLPSLQAPHCHTAGLFAIKQIGADRGVVAISRATGLGAQEHVLNPGEAQYK